MDTWHLGKQPSTEADTCNPDTRKMERILGLDGWPICMVHELQVSSERCLKNRVEKKLNKILQVTSGVQVHKQTQAYTQHTSKEN